MNSLVVAKLRRGSGCSESQTTSECFYGCDERLTSDRVYLVGKEARRRWVHLLLGRYTGPVLWWWEMPGGRILKSGQYLRNLSLQDWSRGWLWLAPELTRGTGLMRDAIPREGAGTVVRVRRAANPRSTLA